jgi:hypothetical protein
MRRSAKILALLLVAAMAVWKREEIGQLPKLSFRIFWVHFGRRRD